MNDDFFESIGKSFVGVFMAIIVRYFSYKFTNVTILPKCLNAFLRSAIRGPATFFVTKSTFGREKGSIDGAMIETVSDESNWGTGRSAAGYDSFQRRMEV